MTSNRQNRMRRAGRLMALSLGCILVAAPVIALGAGRQPGHPDGGLEALGFVTLKNDTDAPDFMLSDLSGKAVRLADYRGKVVFLTFWTTW